MVKAIGLFAMLAVSVMASQVTLAQTPDFSGFWAPEPGMQVEHMAALVDAVTDDALSEQRAHDAYVLRWCNAIGMPAMMDYTLDIRQAGRYMIIASDAHSFVRYVYFDLPARDPSTVDLTSVGQSDGHFAGDTLVVESYAFSGYDYEIDREQQEIRGRIAIPGGGFRTPTSRLVERFTLTNDANALVVESTWTDPAMFAEPQHYKRRYLRREATYEPPARLYCNPFDSERAEFLATER